MNNIIYWILGLFGLELVCSVTTTDRYDDGGNRYVEVLGKPRWSIERKTA